MSHSNCVCHVLYTSIWWSVRRHLHLLLRPCSGQGGARCSAAGTGNVSVVDIAAPPSYWLCPGSSHWLKTQQQLFQCWASFSLTGFVGRCNLQWANLPTNPVSEKLSSPLKVIYEFEIYYTGFYIREKIEGSKGHLFYKSSGPLL